MVFIIKFELLKAFLETNLKNLWEDFQQLLFASKLQNALLKLNTQMARW